MPALWAAQSAALMDQLEAGFHKEPGFFHGGYLVLAGWAIDKLGRFSNNAFERMHHHGG